MSASFWRFGNNYQSVPEINNILQRPDFTLEEVLDDQEIIQELISENGALIEYLSTSEVLEKLVDYIVQDDDVVAQDPDDKELASAGSLQVSEASDEPDNLDQQAKDNDEDSETKTQEATDDDEEEEPNDDLKPTSYDESFNNNNTSTNYGENDMNFDDDNEDDDEEDEEETPEASHHRRAQILAEILSQENWTITHTFMKDNPQLLDNLWTILDKPAPLSMSSSTYFMKINEHLLDQHLEDMIKFILGQELLVERFMRHIDNPPLMDFLLKVISTDKGRELSTGVIDVLQEKHLIPSLISFLGPDHPSTEQSALADFLKLFITISANSNTDNSTIGPNELTRELVSHEMVETLVSLMLHGGSGLANSVGIIIEIIRKNNSDYDIVPVLYITIKSHPPLPTDPIYLGTLVKVFAENIPRFTEMLEKPTLQVLETPFGSIEPLGFERFKICELVAELLHCSNMALLNDEKGEAIVEERDEERVRLKKLAKKRHQRQLENDEGNSQSSDFEENDEDDEGKGIYGEEDISRDINNLDIDDKKEQGEDPASDTMMTEDKNQDDDEEQEGNFSVNMDEGDATQPLPPQTNEEEEAMIRQHQVVGDQLKIALSDNNVIITILDMFFKFPWNNFLHNVVFDIVQQVLNGSMEIGYNKFLAIELFGKGNITKLIIEGQKKCEDYEEQTGLRLGYMGHLTLIAEEVVKFVSLYAPESISMVIHDAVSDEEWNKYVNETLVETREKYNAILGGSIGEDEGLSEDDSRGHILDPSVDHDLGGMEYRDAEGESDEDENDVDLYDPNQDQDPDQDQDDDENKYKDDYKKFSQYFRRQMSRDLLPDKVGSSDEDDEDDEPGSWTMSSDFTSKMSNSEIQDHLQRQLQEEQREQQQQHSRDDDDDEDDYVDPNDDGQSYAKKNHPLYTPTGDLLDQFSSRDSSHQPILSDEEYRTEPLSDEDEYIGSDDDSQDYAGENRNRSYDGDEEDDELGDEDLGLIRSTSKGEMSWDEDEQRRLVSVASYIQSHGVNEK